MRRCGAPDLAHEANRRVTIVRDPLWNNIPLDADAMRLVDTEVFQRLRYVRQLGLAFLVELDFLKGRERLKGRRVTSVIRY